MLTRGRAFRLACRFVIPSNIGQEPQMNFRILAFLSKALVVATLLASQGAKADVLILKNGDRITGEIKRIWDSEITIEPE